MMGAPYRRQLFNGESCILRSRRPRWEHHTVVSCSMEKAVFRRAEGHDGSTIPSSAVQWRKLYSEEQKATMGAPYRRQLFNGESCILRSRRPRWEHHTLVSRSMEKAVFRRAEGHDGSTIPSSAVQWRKLYSEEQKATMGAPYRRQLFNGESCILRSRRPRWEHHTVVSCSMEKAVF